MYSKFNATNTQNILILDKLPTRETNVLVPYPSASSAVLSDLRKKNKQQPGIKFSKERVVRTSKYLLTSKKTFQIHKMTAAAWNEQGRELSVWIHVSEVDILGKFRVALGSFGSQHRNFTGPCNVCIHWGFPLCFIITCW